MQVGMFAGIGAACDFNSGQETYEDLYHKRHAWVQRGPIPSNLLSALGRLLGRERPEQSNV